MVYYIACVYLIVTQPNSLDNGTINSGFYNIPVRILSRGGVMAATQDLKSCDRKVVRVQVPPSAPFGKLKAG